jgi:M6 family metalloprotease-like protein
LIALAISLIPAVAISAQKVTAGSKCKVFKQKVNYLDKTYTCIKSGKYLVWNKGAAVVKPTPLQTPISAPTSKSQSTSTKDISYTPPSVLSDNIELCKIKEVSKSRGMTGAGFPEWNSMTPRSGTVKWALIPIDFPDLPGETNFRQRVDGQMKLLSEWYASVSGGKFKVEWELLDKWVTLPSATSEYAIPLSVNLNDAANGAKLFKDAMNAADPIFDFTNIQTVNFILPKGQTFLTETSQGFPWDSAVKEFKSKEGSISSYSIAGKFFDQPGRTYWSYWAHEFGHAVGLPHIGSSRVAHPFQGEDIMGGQDGPARELSGWLRFIAGWLSEQQVYCQEVSNLKSTDLTLVPLSSTQPGLKVAIVALSKSRALVMESRRVTKFSCDTPTPRNGVLAYIYDATLGHGENFLIPMSIPGRQLEQTIGCITVPTSDRLLHESEKITVEGVNIEVLIHGDYDKIRISRTS